MGLKEILDAAREDIFNALGFIEGGHPMFDLERKLDQRDFVRVLYIAKRAEAMACAEDRPDELVVQTTALKELEGKAPRTCKAIVDALTGGNHLVKEKLRQVAEDQEKVRRAADELRGYEQALGQRALALASGDAMRALPAPRETKDPSDETKGPLNETRNTPTEPAPPPEVIEAELEPAEDTVVGRMEADYRKLTEQLEDYEEPLPPPPELDLPRDPERVADEEMDTENENRKEDVSRYRI